jgi:hypothetical protein
MSDHTKPPVKHGIRRLIYIGVGLFFVGLAVVGTVVPVLPTTPFLLLASFCFIRSSPALNAWLLRSRLFGPMIRDWQVHRGVRPQVKVTAVMVLALAGGSSAFAIRDRPWPVLALLVGLLLTGLIVVLRLPVVRGPREPVEPVRMTDGTPTRDTLPSHEA